MEEANNKLVIRSMINLSPMYMEVDLENGETMKAIVYLDFVNERVYSPFGDLSSQIKEEVINILREKKSQAMPIVPNNVIQQINNQLKEADNARRK